MKPNNKKVTGSSCTKKINIKNDIILSEKLSGNICGLEVISRNKNKTVVVLRNIIIINIQFLIWNNLIFNKLCIIPHTK